MFKSGDTADLSYYRPVSVLPCLSKMLELVMYNRLYQHLVYQEILYPKQFGFQKGRSTDHALIQLSDQIHVAFEKNEYILNNFSDLSKAFDTADHLIHLSKLIRKKNLQ